MKETLGKLWHKKLNSMSNDELKLVEEALEDNTDVFEYPTLKVIALGKALSLTVYQLGWVISGTDCLFTFKQGNIWMVLSKKEMVEEVLSRIEGGAWVDSTTLSIDGVERKTMVSGHLFYVYKIK